jgi:hypothetical protein
VSGSVAKVRLGGEEGHDRCACLAAALISEAGGEEAAKAKYGPQGEGKQLGDLEPTSIGEDDVQENELRPRFEYEFKRRRAVNRLAHDLEPIRFKETAGEAAEDSVVIDDQHRSCHYSNRSG